MEKEKKKTETPKPKNPRGKSYPKDIQVECVRLLKEEGLSVEGVSTKFNGHPGVRAIRRFCKKLDYHL